MTCDIWCFSPGIGRSGTSAPQIEHLYGLGLCIAVQRGNGSDVYDGRGWFAAGTLPADLLEGGTRLMGRRCRGKQEAYTWLEPDYFGYWAFQSRSF